MGKTMIFCHKKSNSHIACLEWIVEPMEKFAICLTLDTAAASDKKFQAHFKTIDSFSQE